MDKYTKEELISHFNDYVDRTAHVQQEHRVMQKLLPLSDIHENLKEMKAFSEEDAVKEGYKDLRSQIMHHLDNLHIDGLKDEHMEIAKNAIHNIFNHGGASTRTTRKFLGVDTEEE